MNMAKFSIAEFDTEGKNKRARGSETGVSSAELEDSIRRVMREELPCLLPFLLKQLLPITTQTHNLIESTAASASGTRDLELRLLGKFPKSIFTLNKLVAESGKKRKPKSAVAIQVALYDARSGSIVNAGPFSSIKVMICVLSGDFGSRGKDDWSSKDFNDSVLREREGKAPLIKGQLFVDLKEGIADISDVSFSDNSSWTGTKKFKLGAKAVQSEWNIREATSEPFRVKDLRGELYEKHYPPFLNDELWRLKMIAKNGKLHEQFSRLKIETVGDLVRANPSTLFKNLKGVSKRKFDAIIQQARTAITESSPECVPFSRKNYEDKEKHPSHSSVSNSIPDGAGYTQAQAPASLQPAVWCSTTDPPHSQEFHAAAAPQENRELMHCESYPSTSALPQYSKRTALQSSPPLQEAVDRSDLSPAIRFEEKSWREILDDFFGADFGVASSCSPIDCHLRSEPVT